MRKSKVLAFITSVISVILIFGMITSVADESLKKSVTIDVVYHQTESREMLEDINKWRADGPSYWDPQNIQRFSPNTSPLTYDYGLEKVAMQRAAELVLNYNSGHLRPDGSKCFTCYVDGVRAYGENIAKGQADAAEVFKAWKEDNDPFSGQGHRRSMLGIIYNSNGQLYGDTFTAIGIACVEFNGQKYWVQEFGYSNSGTPETFALDSSIDVEIEYTDSFTPEGYVAINDGYPPNAELSFTETLNWSVASSLTMIPPYHVYFCLGDMIIRDVTDQATIRWYDKAHYDDDLSDVWNDGNSIVFSNVGTYDVAGEAIVDNQTVHIPFHFSAIVNKGNISSANLANMGEDVSEIYGGYSLKSYCPDQYYLGGSAVIPDFSLKVGNYTLIEGVDYTITSYANNTGVTQGGRPASVKVTGIGERFQGTKTIYFNILPVDLSEAEVQIVNPTVSSDGSFSGVDCTVIYKNHVIPSSNYNIFYSGDPTIAGEKTLTVEGIGNCTGTCSKEFMVMPLDISGADVTLSQNQYSFTGNECRPTVELYINGTKLVDSDSISVSYEDNTNVGEATVSIIGQNNYCGEVTSSFQITAGDISNARVYLNYQRAEYSRVECRPGVMVYMGSELLTKNTDYTVRYEDNTNAGTAKVIVTGTGNYAGEKIATFEITPASINTATVTLDQTEYVYSGSENKPVVTVKLRTYTLVSGEDYDIEYTDNTDAGSATVTVTGKGNYAGTVSTTFTIAKEKIEEAVYDVDEAVYNGTVHNPDFSLVVGGRTLVKDVDFTYEYDDAINAGQGHIYVTGKGNYEGELDIVFGIAEADISEASVTIAGVEYTGAVAEPVPTVVLNGKTLVADTDYSVQYSDNEAIGTATVTITGINNYDGTISKAFKISSANISGANVSVVCDNNVYDGSAKIPSVTVTYKGQILVADVDYKVKLSNNTNAGTATVIITGIGDCMGEKESSFDIVPASISQASVSVPSIDYIHNGTSICPIPTVVLNGKILRNGTDYSYTYSNNVNEGIANIAVEGIGNYTGSVYGNFTIKAPVTTPSTPDQPSQPSNPSTPSMPNTPSTPSTPSQPSTPAGEQSEGGVAGFVERLYTVALGRNSDPNGKNAWINAIKNGESGAQAAKGFLFSDEFLNKPLSNEEFVKILYKTFFDREADQGGLNAWVAALQRGESKQDVIMGFINSTEWANVCLRYGIASGGTGSPSIEVDPNEQVIAFATRLYTTCLKRNPDQNGLMAWARQLANLRDTGSNAAHGFFFSDEMNNNPVSNEEFVSRLYLTFMDRQPDAAGMNAWVGQLNEGVSREEVFQGFAQSSEFGAICANYGIIR